MRRWTCRRRRRSKTPSAACSNWRKPVATMAASSRSTMRWRWRSTWRAPPSSVTAIFPAFPPASIRSTPAWAACSVPTLSYLPVVRVWARPRLPPTSPITSRRPTIRKFSLMVRSRRKTAASSASTRSKCRPNSWQPVSFQSKRKCLPRKSAAVTLPRPISRSSSPAPR
ncbi:hypothetical protein D3C87_1438280 [compost metagenome]